MSASVHTEPAARATGAIDAVIASLPLSLHASAELADADLVAVDGCPGWPARLHDHVVAGARGAVVIDPVAEDAPELGVPVVVDRVYASHPAIADAARLAEAIGVEALVEVRIEVPAERALERALLDGLALARSITGAKIEAGHVLVRTSRALSARVRFSDRRTGLLTLVRTGAREPTALVRLLSSSASLVAEVPPPGTARPASVLLSTGTGETRAPLRFESAHRHSWRRLLEQPPPGGDLADADADTRALRLLLDPSSSSLPTTPGTDARPTKETPQ
ncbi:hypothetical protein [Rathayibacter sp. VKM Ac-2927]|uniref:hypothetical protein n=1 Tax=Rathayibacter sp. VKM Ac-2927 TaxID=2929478 RepID=UPI001FB39D16|nr:hypothetical protein [Rathayibacter sp. VKM Ac-2927]MCJ1688370.1 hypothetical protein [Rathayibacter sp. VKM Ac-2927]